MTLHLIDHLLSLLRLASHLCDTEVGLSKRPFILGEFSVNISRSRSNAILLLVRPVIMAYNIGRQMILF